MSEQPLSTRGPQPPQRLSPLSGLSEEETAFAQHLRDLREDLGMSSTDIVKWLKESEPGAAVDASRLSRYLSGTDLPKPSLLPALYRLLATRRAVDPDRMADGWKLLYAAARTKGPLVAREYKEEASRIALEEHRVQTAHALAGLREQLDRGREHRERLGESLADVFTRAEGTHQQAQDLEEELRRVGHRLDELEDLVQQHESVLRLLQADSERAAQARRETGTEIDLWRGNVPASWTEDPMALARGVIALRDEGADEQADHLLSLAARDLPVALLPEVYDAFEELGRLLERSRLTRSISAQRKAKDILALTTPGEKLSGPFLNSREFLEIWAEQVLVETGTRAAARELLLLMRLLDETGRVGHKIHLIKGLKQRTEGLAEIAASGVFQSHQVPAARGAARGTTSAAPRRRRWFRS
ncbi:helix-turn-helix domain-containing protein [Streptomyces sp. NBC_00096]|uniref:helix-turn-helix domain-containing protein n=1 Tax=Streptomyces sp. NBC_00096 TaxID=2975650 RepID=UPI003243306A